MYTQAAQSYDNSSNNYNHTDLTQSTPVTPVHSNGHTTNTQNGHAHHRHQSEQLKSNITIGSADDAIDDIPVIDGIIQGTFETQKQYCIDVLTALRSTLANLHSHTLLNHILIKFKPFLQHIHNQCSTQYTQHKNNNNSLINNAAITQVDQLTLYMLRNVLPSTVRILLSYEPNKQTIIHTQLFIQQVIRIFLYTIQFDIVELYLTVSHIFGAPVSDNNNAHNSLTYRSFYTTPFLPIQARGKSNLYHITPIQYFTIESNDNTSQDMSLYTVFESLSFTAKQSDRIYVSATRKVQSASYYQLQNIQYFGEQNGFDRMNERVRCGHGGTNASIPMNNMIIIHILHTLIEIRYISDLSWLSEYIVLIRENVLLYYMELDMESIKYFHRKILTKSLQQLTTLLHILQNTGDINEIFEKFELRFGYKLLQCTYLDKRIQGLNEIKELCELVEKKELLRRSKTTFSYVSAYVTASDLPGANVTSTQQYAQSLWLTIDYMVKWILDVRLLNILYEPHTTHIELIRRSVVILKILQYKNELTCDHLDTLWLLTSDDKHESIVHLVYDIISELASHLTQPLLRHMLIKIHDKQLSQYDNMLLALVRNFTLSIYKSPVDFKQDNNMNGLDIFWKLIQLTPQPSFTIQNNTTNNTSPNNMQLIRVSSEQRQTEVQYDIAVKASEYFTELISLEAAQPQRQKYLELCVQNIQHQKQVCISLQLFRTIIVTYPSSVNWFDRSTQSQSSMLVELNKRYQLLDLILNELILFKQSIIQLQQSGQLDHNSQQFIYNVSTRQDVLVFILSSSSLSLTRSQMDTLWHQFVMNAVSIHQRDVFYRWLISACDESGEHVSLTDSLKEYVYKHHIQNITADQLTCSGFQLLYKYYVYVDSKAGAIKINTQVNSTSGTAGTTDDSADSATSTTNTSVAQNTSFTAPALSSNDSTSNTAQLSDTNELDELLDENELNNPLFLSSDTRRYAAEQLRLLGAELIVVNYKELSGIDLLSDIAFNSIRPVVARHAIRLLNVLHYNLSPKLKSQHQSIQSNYLKKCLNYLSLTLANANNDNTTQQRRIISRSVYLLKTFLTLFSSTDDSSNTLIFTIRADKQFRCDPLELHIDSHSTIGELRQRIYDRTNAYQCGLTYHTIELTWNDKKLVSNHIQLSTVPFQSGDSIHVTRDIQPVQLFVHPAEQPIQPIPTQYDMYTAVHNSQLTSTQTNNTVQQTVNSTPLTNTNKSVYGPLLSNLASDQVTFDRLFHMLSLSSELSADAWQILTILPVNSRYMNNIVSISTSESIAWSTLLDTSNIYRLIYTLRILVDIIDGRLAQSHAITADQLLHSLMQNDGIQHIIIVCTQLSAAQQLIQCTALELLYRLIIILIRYKNNKKLSAQVLCDFMHTSIINTIIEFDTTVYSNELLYTAYELIELLCGQDEQIRVEFFMSPQLSKFIDISILHNNEMIQRQLCCTVLLRLVQHNQQMNYVIYMVIVNLLLVPPNNNITNYTALFHLLIELINLLFTAGSINRITHLADTLINALYQYSCIELYNNIQLIDYYLIGLVHTLYSIFHHATFYVDQSSQLIQLCDYLYNHCLFNQQMQCQCKSIISRNAVYALLNLLCERYESCYTHMLHILYMSDICTVARTQWNYSPITLEREGIDQRIGLRNLGATCYQNSLYQLLYYNNKFTHSLLRTRTEPGTILYELQNIFLHLKLSQLNQYDCIAVNKYNNTQNLYEQKDVFEYCEYILQLIHSAAPAILNNIFHCRIVNQIISKNCDHIRQNIESAEIISLTVKNKSNLLQSLDLYVAVDLLDGDNKYYCDQCQCKVIAEKNTLFHTLPNYLFLHLKRFEYNFDDMNKYKINTLFSFPLSLNMKPYTKQSDTNVLEYNELYVDHRNHTHTEPPNDSDYLYQLCGILIHTGQADSGHYFSLIKVDPTNDNSWYEFNDDKVRPFDIRNIDTMCYGGYDTVESIDNKSGKTIQKQIPIIQNAYMLLYEKIIQHDTNNNNNTGTTTTATSTTTTTTTGSTQSPANGHKLLIDTIMDESSDSDKNSSIDDDDVLNMGSVKLHSVDEVTTTNDTTIPGQHQLNDHIASNNKLHGLDKRAVSSASNTSVLFGLDTAKQHSAQIDSSSDTVSQYSTDIVSSIARENIDFLTDKYIFDFSYVTYMWNMLHIKHSTTTDQRNGKSILYYRTLLMTQYVFKIYVRSSDHTSLHQWLHYLYDLYTQSTQSRIWLLDQVSDDTQFTENILFLCPLPHIRQAFVDLLVHVTSIHSQKPGEKLKYISPHEYSKSKSGTNKNMMNTTVKSISPITRMISTLLELLPVVRRYWRCYTQYFRLLRRIAEISIDERRYMIEQGAISGLITFYSDVDPLLNFNMRGAWGSEPARRIHPPSTDQCMMLISILIRSCTTDTSTHNHLLPSTTIDLSPIDRDSILAGITYNNAQQQSAQRNTVQIQRQDSMQRNAFIPWAIADRASYKSMCDIITYWSVENQQFSLKILDYSMKGLISDLSINDSSTDYRHYLRYICSLLCIRDTQSKQRAEYILPQLTQLSIKLASRRTAGDERYLQSTHKYIYQSALRSRYVYDWLCNNREWNEIMAAYRKARETNTTPQNTNNNQRMYK